MNPDLVPKIGQYTFTLIGLGLLIGAFFIYKNNSEFIKNSRHAEGTVINLEEGEDTTYPVVDFQTNAGETIQFKSSYGSSPPAFEIGEKVKVLYHADTPERAKINQFTSLWLSFLIVGGLGIIFLATGVGSILWGKWRLWII